MSADSLITDTLATFAIREDNADAVVIPLPRRANHGNVGTVGRARFSGDLCTDHPHWFFGNDDVPVVAIPGEFPCAKFSGLPGKGRGIKQPNIGKVLLSTTLELVKPLLLIGMLIGGLYGFNVVVLHGGGHHFHVNVLRPRSDVRPTTSGVPNSGVSPTPNPLHGSRGSVNRRSTVSPTSIHTHSVVKP